MHDCYIYSTSKDGAVKVWLFDEGELQPLYTRRRKEANASIFGPTQWQTVDVHNDVLYLGDNTCRMKALDWRLGKILSKYVIISFCRLKSKHKPLFIHKLMLSFTGKHTYSDKQ